MRIVCPHCGRPAKIRTSRAITPLTREAYVQCENIECCCVFRVIVSAVSTIVPSRAPNPEVFLPSRGHGKSAPEQMSLL